MDALRRSVEELMALDDRMLADIGLTRGNVEYAVRYGRLPANALPTAARGQLRSAAVYTSHSHQAGRTRAVPPDNRTAVLVAALIPTKVGI